MLSKLIGQTALDRRCLIFHLQVLGELLLPCHQKVVLKYRKYVSSMIHCNLCEMAICKGSASHRNSRSPTLTSRNGMLFASLYQMQRAPTPEFERQVALLKASEETQKTHNFRFLSLSCSRLQSFGSSSPVESPPAGNKDWQGS